MLRWIRPNCGSERYIDDDDDMPEGCAACGNPAIAKRKSCCPLFDDPSESDRNIQARSVCASGVVRLLCFLPAERSPGACSSRFALQMRLRHGCSDRYLFVAFRQHLVLRAVRLQKLLDLFRAAAGIVSRHEQSGKLLFRHAERPGGGEP